MRRAVACDDSATARAEWSAFRGLAPARALVAELRRMAGTRERCFYCSDARATDVDHYVPIAFDWTKTFEWTNHLWTCTDCNRRKSQRFPTDAAGNALVIDPTVTDPWAHLALATTGVVAPKVHLGDMIDRQGTETLDVLSRINHEAVIEGRARTIRRLRRAVDELLERGDSAETRKRLIDEVREDDFGVGWWFLNWEGETTSPFAELRGQHPKLWRRLVTTVVAGQHGL
jgi:uncharacterized protein (TIGR02646 family)